jgi:hypothetical protein
MRNVPFGIDSAPIQKFPRLQRNINVDIVAVGAGITGITDCLSPEKRRIKLLMMVF